jgi:predicted CxxxxCH...CXXCH cytochrome family protein
MKFLKIIMTNALLSLMLISPTVTFAALKCYDCHGTKITATSGDIRPEDDTYRNISSGGFVGNHRSHVSIGAEPVSCDKCHPVSRNYSSAHRDGMIKISPNINQSRFITTYNNRTSAWPQTAAISNEAETNKCTNVNCHFEKETPKWGSNKSVLTCDSCHISPPSSGSHAKKHGDYYGTGSDSCAKCHENHVAAVNTFAHASSAGKRGIKVQFTTAPNSGGIYAVGSNAYPDYLLPTPPSPRDGSCTDLYCHSDGRGGAPVKSLSWSDTKTTDCFTCHRGRAADSVSENCTGFGVWSSITATRGYCTPDLAMSSNGHHQLVGTQWVRQYPCYYCHNNTVDTAGNIKDMGKHVNGFKDVAMSAEWNIVGRPAASYIAETKTCDNVYCHSDGTTDPDTVKAFAWTEPKTECNTCHGHSLAPDGCGVANCHDNRVDENGKLWTPKTGWLPGQEWMSAMPMFPNTGAGTARANSHTRHSQTDFTCDNCHAATVINGSCTSCHDEDISQSDMKKESHINPDYHVNKAKDVVFKDGGSYGALTKVCSGTKCHANGADPVWGGSINDAITCLACHGTTGKDRDTYQAFSGYTQARINLSQFYATGHGRYSTSGNYPVSGNPAANFPGNPCWYCHDNNILHKDTTNPFRLRKHYQYENRFAKECVYCHMEGDVSECLSCHNALESLSPQLTSPEVIAIHSGATYLSGCGKNTACHFDNQSIHKTNNEKFWTLAEKNDVKNQYVMMGVCLQCHDDDSSNQCTSCHNAPVDNPLKYSLGFNPGIEGSRFVKPKKARASASHFGYKHYRSYTKEGIWRGGKFCWDCHDPHGDANIYMVHDKVATTTDGTHGVPLTRAEVSFTRKQSGLDYARINAPYNGICNVCHTPESKHYTSTKGDGHNSSRVCISCHEHRFADSHANKLDCNTSGCHDNKKPVPKHTAFGLPRDCTKCHLGTISMRMDVMGQLRSNSHHIQRPDGEIKNTDCYPCHWEANANGLINIEYHEGYNYFNYSTAKNKKVDLVIYGAGVRPTIYKNNSSAVQFTASNMTQGLVAERVEVSTISSHCLSCHSDQNNDTDPFGDCKTPRQYAWDRSSVAARYSQTGTTTWGKYPGTANAAKKNITKALSAHGNAAGNSGGWSRQTGIDGDIPNTRNGIYAVQCFDCHNSHGSKAIGTTSSYVTFNGTKNGANLKETQAGKGGYAMSYKASANTAANAINPYNTGAGQCFDCHLTRTSGMTPWGYFSTFGAISSVMGYKDTLRFGQGTKGSTARFGERDSKKIILGGHMKASSPLNSAATGTIDGLCTPCHDPHGVSPSLESDQAYAVPLLKGTWMTAPYKEDQPPPDPYGNSVTSGPDGIPRSWGKYQATPYPTLPIVKYNLDRTTFGGSTRIAENEDRFAGLCLRCHQKASLTDGVNKNQNWKSVDRIHESVKGWGANSEHSYTCSKCHQPHNSGLPRLMQTDCLDHKHRGNRPSGGVPWRADSQSGSAHSHGKHRGFPNGDTYGDSASYEATSSCHGSANGGIWPDNNSWNSVTTW